MNDEKEKAILGIQNLIRELSIYGVEVLLDDLKERGVLRFATAAGLPKSEEIFLAGKVKELCDKHIPTFGYTDLHKEGKEEEIERPARVRVVLLDDEGEVLREMVKNERGED